MQRFGGFRNVRCLLRYSQPMSPMVIHIENKNISTFNKALSQVMKSILLVET